MHDLKPDDPLSPEEEAEALMLTAVDLQNIDHCLLSHTSLQWQKVARVVGSTMMAIGDGFPRVPDLFYSQRIKYLAESGALEVAGDLNRMRYSEIRRRK
jgi:hypothetical protein